MRGGGLVGGLIGGSVGPCLLGYVSGSLLVQWVFRQTICRLVGCVVGRLVV